MLCMFNVELFSPLTQVLLVLTIFGGKIVRSLTVSVLLLVPACVAAVAVCATVYSRHSTL